MHNARHLWMAIIVIAAVIIGVAGGTLAWLDGTGVPNAALTGAGGFGTSIALMLAIAYFLDDTRSR